jgi:hypothetical protein
MKTANPFSRALALSTKLTRSYILDSPDTFSHSLSLSLSHSLSLPVYFSLFLFILLDRLDCVCHVHVGKTGAFHWDLLVSRGKDKEIYKDRYIGTRKERESVCVCVCVCARERR